MDLSYNENLIASRKALTSQNLNFVDSNFSAETMEGLKGNRLYIDENGVLRASNPTLARATERYMDANGLGMSMETEKVDTPVSLVESPVLQ